MHNFPILTLQGQLLFDQAMLIARVEQPPAPLPGCQQQEAEQEQQQGHEQEQQEHATMIDWQLLSDARQQVCTQNTPAMHPSTVPCTHASLALPLLGCPACVRVHLPLGHPTPPLPLPRSSPLSTALQEGSRWFELLGDPFDVPQPSSVFVGFNATSGKLTQTEAGWPVLAALRSTALESASASRHFEWGCAILPALTRSFPALLLSPPTSCAPAGNWKRGLVFDTVRLCRLPPSPPAEPAAPAASPLAQQAQLAVEGVRGTLQRLSRGLQGLLGL